MSVLRLKIKGWEDGEPVERWLEKPDRWQLHSADQVTLVIDDMEVTINQKVRAADSNSANRPSSSHHNRKHASCCQDVRYIGAADDCWVVFHARFCSRTP